MAISESTLDLFAASGSSSDQQVPSWISLSLEDKISECVRFIRKTDKSAYTHVDDIKLENHIRYAIETGQIYCVFSGDTDDLIHLATWNVLPKEQVVFLVGIIGDKQFLRHMLSMWHGMFPFYDLRYFRKGRTVQRKNTKLLIYN